MNTNKHHAYTVNPYTLTRAEMQAVVITLFGNDYTDADEMNDAEYAAALDEDQLTLRANFSELQDS